MAISIPLLLAICSSVVAIVVSVRFISICDFVILPYTMQAAARDFVSSVSAVNSWLMCNRFSSPSRFDMRITN